MSSHAMAARLCADVCVAAAAAAVFALTAAVAMPTPTTHTDYDVLVLGATPAGVQAAVAAAREGARVALIEPTLYVGGAMAGGLGKSDVGVHPSANMGQCFEFFTRVAQHYGVPGPLKPLPHGACDPPGDVQPWVFEPHVAEDTFVDMLRGEGHLVDVMLQERIAEVSKNESTGRITAVRAVSTRGDGDTPSATVRDAGWLTASQYVDASYEGWLMRLTPGVSYTWGREGVAEYNESVAGVLPEPTPRGVPYGHSHQFQVDVNPYADAANTTCLPHVSCAPPGAVGSGDAKVGAYDWRMCLTSNASNMLPIPQPAPGEYDPAEFEILRRTIAAYNATNQGVPWSVPHNGVPNQKTDWKVGGPPGFTGEYVGGSWAYPNATWEQQQAIVAEHRRFTTALLHFWRTDPAVPLKLREQLAPGRVGMPRDEFNRTAGHWPSQLYVREATRLRGQYVMSQRDLEVDFTKDDSIGLGSYSIDIPGAVQRVPMDGRTLLEGGMQSPELCSTSLPAYAVPLRSLRPKSNECTNLFVPVALSATHVAFSAVRMEPTWMVLGQSAGVAAAMAAASPTGGVNVTALQARLTALGQVIEPIPPKP